jgi:5'-nucleotidase
VRRALLAVVVATAIAGPSAIVGPAGAGHADGPAEARHDDGRLEYGGGAAIEQQEEPGSPRASAPLTILQLNDVYSTVPIDGMGGLARVATLKQNLIAAGRTPLLILAGDFLSPSVASSIFKGEQMVAALNAAGLDIATLGNHEFDFGPDVLLRRMKEANWQWVVSNVIDTNTNKPIGGAAPYLVRTFGALKVGFIGLVLTSEEINQTNLGHVRLIDPIRAAGTYLPALKRQRVNLIVAITHLAFEDDRRLVERFPEIDLVIGGHEHYPITATANRTFISKAGSDARWVARIDVNRRRNVVERFFELLPVTSAIADEPRTAQVVASYESRLGAELAVVVGTTKVPLDADSVRMRANETNIGDMFADAMRMSAGSDVTIVNSGSIRGDRIYPAGPLARRTLVEMHPFGGVVCKVEVTGKTLLQALNSGVSKMPATAGQFPQLSGMTMTLDAKAAGDKVREVRVGGQPLDLNKTYTVAVTDYQLAGGDGYGMFKDGKVLISQEAGELIVTALEKYVASKGEIAPALEGRITILK